MNEYDYTLDKTGFYKILFSTSLTVAKEQLQTALTPKKLAGAVEYMCMLCTLYEYGHQSKSIGEC